MNLVDLASLNFNSLYLASVIMVTLAEMGDKTQLLAMAFATRYSAWKVLIGVLFATILNHALAVWVGTAIASFNSVNSWLQLLAALLFIFFGLWTLRGDKLQGEDKRITKFGPILTVSIAFFIAELGDKTQLATINISVIAPQYPAAILLGTTTGMLIADAIGIVIGIILAKKIPEKTIKMVSAVLFIGFGFINTIQSLYEEFSLSTQMVGGIMVGISIMTIVLSCILLRKRSNNAEVQTLAARYKR